MAAIIPKTGKEIAVKLPPIRASPERKARKPTFTLCRVTTACPNITNKGPIAATISPIVTIIFCTGSGAETNLSTNPEIESATFLTAGAKIF